MDIPKDGFILSEKEVICRVIFFLFMLKKKKKKEKEANIHQSSLLLPHVVYSTVFPSFTQLSWESDA